jgi:Popeye protein conserved region
VVDLCIHVANVLYLLSFLARDMLWLRILTCLGLGLGVVFFTCQPAPMYGPTVWHLVFLGINFVQIRRLILERRRLMLPPPVQQAAENACKDLSHDQLLALLTRAMWAHPDTLQDVRKALGRPLTHEEEVVRDLALCRLSRSEMLNLLTRRLFATFRRAWGGREAARARSQGELATALGPVAYAAGPPTALPALEDRR